VLGWYHRQDVLAPYKEQVCIAKRSVEMKCNTPEVLDDDLVVATIITERKPVVGKLD
jgi:hypothetical protein